MATIQRTGRTNRSPGVRQYMFLGQGMAEISFGRFSERISRALRPFLVTSAATYSPFGVVTRASLVTSTPTFLAKACAAGVGWPSLKATLTDGPLRVS